MRPALKLAAASFCLIGLAGTAALAADDAELERIRLAIAEAITPGPDPTDPHIVLAEPVGAAWRDGRAIISLKGAKVVTPGDSTAIIGDVEIAVLPRDAGFYDFDVTMPKSFDIIAVDGTPEGKFIFGGYRLAGTWAREVGSLTNLDAAFANIEVKDMKPDGDDLNATLGKLEARMNYTKGPDGLWSGTANAGFSDFHMLADGSEDVSIARLEIKGSTAGSDWAAWQQVMDKMGAFSEPNATPPTEAARKALGLALRNVNWGANDGSLSISGISASSGGQRIFTLGNTTLKLALDGVKEAGPFSFRLAVDDLSVEENTLPTNLAPTKGALDFTFDPFPVRALFGSMFEQMMDELMAPPPSAEDSANVIPPDDGTEAMPSNESQEAMPPDNVAEGEIEPPPSETQEAPMMGPFAADDLFLQQLFAFGTVFALNEFSINAPGTGVNASGRLKVDMEAMGMGTGKLKASVRGIDALLAYANAEAQSDEEMKDAATFLIFLKGLGKPESGAGGETAYVYEIDVPKDGPPTVNGTPLDGIMGQ